MQLIPDRLVGDDVRGRRFAASQPWHNFARRLTAPSALAQDVIDNIRGAVMICYPMGLPEWDLVRMLLEDREDDIPAQVGGAHDAIPIMIAHDDYLTLTLYCKLYWHIV